MIIYNSFVNYNKKCDFNDILAYDLQIMELIRYVNKHEKLIYFSNNIDLNSDMKQYKEKYNFKIKNIKKGTINIAISNNIDFLNKIIAKHKILYIPISDSSVIHNNIYIINDLKDFIGKISEISKF